MTPQLSALDHLVLTVADIARTSAFYETVLGMSVVQFKPADGTTRTALTFADQKINLHQSGHEFDPGARRPTPGSADLCFVSDTPVADWQAHLRRTGVPIEEGPVPRCGAVGPIISIYLRDPDGNLIEISNRA